MFVPHAKVRIVGFGPRPKKKRFHRRRLAIKELVKMPCLLPTMVTVVIGLVFVASGAGMAAAGYLSVPKSNATSSSIPTSNVQPVNHPRDAKYYLLKTCSYMGPLIMAFGLFAIIVACVLYCEIIDKYSMLVPDKKANVYGKEELYQIIIGEMKKSYAQCLITAYTKATERSLTIDTQSYSGDYMSDHTLPYRPPEPLTLDQQIDLECDGYTPSPPIPNKRYSIIQARIQRLRSEDNWLKTSSLPNIRRSENASIRRAGRAARLRQTKKHSISCDYTMDEARNRRKSMMLRSFLLGNSCSSGELQQKRASRRFSSVKVLPSENTFSWEEISQMVASNGSFPITRLVQRRGTFACGDMRTRRMKFLLLLQASESKDNVSIDGRPSVSNIRRKSFIPYTDCDRFITTEERRHNRDRRPSFNPFIPAGNRLGQPMPVPANSGRRHSFYPIRRDDQIYVSDPYEQRRHSFNPIGINNTLKPEFANAADSRRGSFNPDSMGDSYSRRGSFIPPQKSNFLMVPGVEIDKLVSERHPAAQVDSYPHKQNQSQNINTLKVPYDLQSDRKAIERRHSFNPPTLSSTLHSGKDIHSQSSKVPQIVINSDSSNNSFLTVPSHDVISEERRHSFNTVDSSKSQRPQAPAATVSFKGVDRPTQQKMSFRLTEQTRLPAPSQHYLMPSSIPHHPYLAAQKTSRPPEPSDVPSTSTTSIEIRRPSSFKEEITTFQPLSLNDSRSVSPVSNISCCGSEKVGATRTASISSERTVRTNSPMSTATEFPTHGESLERPPTPLTTSEYGASGNYPNLSPQCSIEIQKEEFPCSPSAHRRTSSFRSSRKSKSSSKAFGNVKAADSPASTGSGPATLLPSATLDANAALQRSKSASAIAGSETPPTPPFVSYAMLSPSASTARPSIKDKTVRGKQRHQIEDRS